MIECNLKQFKSLIFSSNVFSDISYIGITGSIGRGEKDINDDNINDIDFIVIASSCNYNKKYLLDKELQKITNTRFTDILYLNDKKFIAKVKKIYIEQYLFDFIFGNLPIYSKINLEQYKNINYKISLISAKDVLFTRLWALIAPFKIENNNLTHRDDLYFSMYQLKKAYSAIIDAVLIKENLYNSPQKSIKVLIFKQSSFYQSHFEVIKLVEYDKFQEFNIEVYRNVLYLYDVLIQELIGSKLSYLNFPRKIILLKSIFVSSLKKYIDDMIIKYNLITDLKNYLDGYSINIELFNKNNNKIYIGVIK